MPPAAYRVKLYVNGGWCLSSGPPRRGGRERGRAGGQGRRASTPERLRCCGSGSTSDLRCTAHELGLRLSARCERPSRITGRTLRTETINPRSSNTFDRSARVARGCGNPRAPSQPIRRIRRIHSHSDDASYIDALMRANVLDVQPEQADGAADGRVERAALHVERPVVLCRPTRTHARTPLYADHPATNEAGANHG